MKDPDYHRFDANFTTEAVLTELSDIIGIVMRDASGPVAYWIDADGELWKRIGRVSVRDDGIIEVWPYAAINADDQDALRGAGSEAWHNPPTARNSWTRHDRDGDGWWDCRLSVPVRMIREAAISNREHAPMVGQLEPAA